VGFLQGSTSSIIFIIVILALFYLLMLLPQRRNQKRRMEMMQKLGPGAKVLTTAGIYGEVVTVGEDRLTVRIAPDVEVEMDQRAILNVLAEAPTTSSKTAMNEGETSEASAKDE
jgi:preprotein translocase subunit YajC